jgi:hypothetical protein
MSHPDYIRLHTSLLLRYSHNPQSLHQEQSVKLNLLLSAFKMIPIVFSSPIPIANEQARQLQAQAQAQPQTTQSPQTVPSSNSSQSAPSQGSGSGSSSAVCFVPCCTTIAEMTGSVTSAAPWFDANLHSHPPGYSTLVSPQQQYQHQGNSIQQQPALKSRSRPPKQRQMHLNTPGSQPTSRNSQPLPTLHAHIHPRSKDNSGRSNAH